MRKLRYFVIYLLIASFLLMPVSPVRAAEAGNVTEEVTRVREVESLRETNSETYLMSDGTYECVVYAENKYYLDEDETLRPIDNAIVLAARSFWRKERWYPGLPNTPMPRTPLM